MDKASPEGQKQYLLKCIETELGERLLALTDATTPIFDIPNDPKKSVMIHLIEEFNRRFRVTNRRKDFFLQSQGPQQYTAYVDKLRNMAVEANLANAIAEDLIVVMGIVGCREEELRGDLQKLESPKLQDVIKIGEAYKRKTFAEKGFTVKVNAQQTTSCGGARPKQPKKQEDSARRKEIERLMKGKCYRCGEGHPTDQCSQKGSSLKCTSCRRKGHIAKACYTDMLEKSGAIKTNAVQALPIPGQLAITQEATSLPTRMIKATIAGNTASSARHNLPKVQPAGQVKVDGRIINLDAPPKPIPNLWL